MKRIGLIGSCFTVFGFVAHAAELDQVFNKLEPAYTTMAGANACGLRPRVGEKLWQYAERTVEQLEKAAELTNPMLAEKRKLAEDEGKTVALIGACGSVYIAFQFLDLRRKAEAPSDADKSSTSPRSSTASVPAPPQAPPGKPSSTKAASSTPKQLIQDWLEANEDCRGGYGNDPNTMKACDRRADVGDKLLAIGYCEGDVRKAPWVRCR
ncbi:hypothetical protein NOJ05_07015 [Neorhizobium galegae]|uniref:hypothetical protein n=1 Tax=Neorhizobium galegae TaxID=399 RepID=UPI000622738D|nr:hypothetical protein [Neorhizobium galegae]CDZ64772.1 Hypothetical protein NGAL_HAMBI2566_62040 [Neorhizobium galegae bv. orientalis]KAB1120013.1 hypothetical protein F4V90_31120 [Neorhizobium galegae]MCQ1776946.1 hypothetical protein [Neorhizobium galegae]MCQ1795864.1 hypothetical protein [Neorhizobium galegae]MCQ1810647.1 hypothetical protein [Neorhizobium galegae]